MPELVLAAARPDDIVSELCEKINQFCVMLRAENYNSELAFQCIDELITLAAGMDEDRLIEVNIESARQSLEALLPVNEPGLAIGINQVVALLTHFSPEKYLQAASIVNYNILKMYLDEYKTGPKMLACDKDGNNILMLLAYSNDLEIFEFVCQKLEAVGCFHEAVSSFNHRHQSALMIAINVDSIDVAQFLINKMSKDELLLYQKIGETALSKAEKHSDDSLLLSIMARIPKVDPLPPVFNAIKYGNGENVMREVGNFLGAAGWLTSSHRFFRAKNNFLASGSSINKLRDAHGRGVMHYAVSSEAYRELRSQFGVVLSFNEAELMMLLQADEMLARIELINFLLDKRADINAVDNNLNTPLMFAVQTPFMTTVHHLVERGANLNLQNKRGETALMRAVRAENTEVVAGLIRAGADMSLVNHRQQSAYDIALLGGNTAIMNVLMELAPVSNHKRTNGDDGSPSKRLKK
ncbi:MAG TPA: ankyrin repeat domain-containing protein [Gammaproteobacteria bacterium]|jgi:ankyrin repeat protein|nr:ankyrin repeat domain-containing protein [Gammaproteobacteria bacterium]